MIFFQRLNSSAMLQKAKNQNKQASNQQPYKLNTNNKKSMEEKCTVEVYWSIDHKYYSFLIENSPNDEIRRDLHIHILDTYEVFFDKLPELIRICDVSTGKPREHVQGEIEKLVKE